MPEINPDDMPAVQAMGARRYEKFMETLRKNLGDGERVLHSALDDIVVGEDSFFTKEDLMRLQRAPSIQERDMKLQVLVGIFEKTDTGFKGRIKTLLSDLKLYIEEADAELKDSEEAPDYVIKSKYSAVGYGWNGTDDVAEDGKAIRIIELVFREPFCHNSMEARLTQRECNWIMQWNPFPKYRLFPLPPFEREPQIVVDAERNSSRMTGEQ
jgi:uncharacterized protein (DUF736 family)